MRISVFKSPWKASISKSDSGAALVVVLVLLVLMLGVILAFFSQSIFQRQISKSSASHTAVDLLAQGATNTIIGDLVSEIEAPANNSIILTSDGIDVFRAKPANILPLRSGTFDTLKNLIKRSVAFPDLFGSGVPSRAASVSTLEESKNSRFISKERWNKPLLMPEDAFASFVSPNWVMVSRDGKNPVNWSNSLKWERDFQKETDSVIGRYAFTIYNEGGLLDANVAGFPAIAKTAKAAPEIENQTKYKPALSYADLSVLPGFDQAAIEKMINWRNEATLNASGSPSESYFALSMRNSNNFVTTSNSASAGDSSDRMFISRQQLIEFFNSYLGLQYQPVLQYLGTFSRTLNQPSYWPDPGRPKVKNAAPKSGNPTNGNTAKDADDQFNPAFLTVRVQADFNRADKSRARVGEPLVKKRFSLDRLCWITYKGPSANLDLGDAAYKELTDNGVNPDLIKRGTEDNIKNYFGLTWNGGNQIGGYWTYEHGINTGGQVAIGTLDEVAVQNREPDFFELLKAAINAGSLGRAAPSSVNYPGNTGTYQAVSDSRVNSHIFQIGANIIDCTNPTGYPTEIRFSDGKVSVGTGVSTVDVDVTRRIFGNQDLPYLSSLDNIAFISTPADPAPTDNESAKPKNPAITLQNPGVAVALAVPSIWNPNGYKAGTTKVMKSILYPSDLQIAISTIPPVGPQSYTGTSFCYVFPRYSFGTSVADVQLSTLNTAWTSDDVTALQFKNLPNLYREPTALLRAGFPQDSQLQAGPSNLSMTGGGITETGSNAKLLGFLFGKFPARWNANNPTAGAQNTFTTNVVGLQPRAGYTIRLSYKTGSGWVAYKEYYFNGQFVPIVCPVAEDGVNYPYTWPATATGASTWNGNPTLTGRGYGSNMIPTTPTGNMVWDPRSMRWGLLADNWARPVLDATNSLTTTFRPGGEMPNGSALYNYTHGTKPTAIGQNNNTGDIGSDGMFPYADPDGIPRKAMGAYSVGGGGPNYTAPVEGLPLATTVSGAGFNASANQWESRPIILHRPFRSVAELGYVFRDVPWKNIDFFTPESGDTALLDVFCVHEDNRLDAVTAGKVDLNTNQPLVLKSILTGAYRDEFGTDDITSVASDLATKLIQRTTSTDTNKGPFRSVGDLVGRWVTGDGITTAQGVQAKNVSAKYAGFTSDLPSSVGSIQRFREAAIRALADTGQAGTWNLLIDVIAQTGRYPSSAGSLKDFFVEGEKRLWVHVAIDRQTGKIVDQQVEEVAE